jgi:hypothetical protein
MKSLIYATKQLTVLGLFLTFQTVGNAQAYEFTHFNEPYTEVTNGTLVPSHTIWVNELPVTVPLGFTFPYFNFQLDSLEVFQVVLHKVLEYNNSPLGVQLFPFSANYTFNNSNSTEISYRTTGTAGNKIFVVQWKDLALLNDSIGNSHANIQAWLYEADGSIEFRFGDMLINGNQSYYTNQPGGFTALIYYTNPDEPQTSSSSLCLLDSAENPTMTNYSDFLEPYTVFGYPANGQVYRFARADAGISEQLSATAFTITPNPGNDNILISTESQFDKIALYSMDGQLVLTTTMDAMSKQLNVQELAKGSYIIELSNNLTRQTQRFIKI